MSEREPVDLSTDEGVMRLLRAMARHLPGPRPEFVDQLEAELLTMERELYGRKPRRRRAKVESHR
jgi:hypothetical protein